MSTSLFEEGAFKGMMDISILLAAGTHCLDGETDMLLGLLLASNIISDEIKGNSVPFPCSLSVAGQCTISPSWSHLLNPKLLCSSLCSFYQYLEGWDDNKGVYPPWTVFKYLGIPLT